MPFSEDDSTDYPISLYAATKKSNEVLAHAYSHLYQIPTTGLRFFTVYGPWGRPDMAIFKFVDAILAGRPVELYNYGRLRRDFTYVDDVVESIVRLVPVVPKADAGKAGRRIGIKSVIFACWYRRIPSHSANLSSDAFPFLLAFMIPGTSRARHSPRRHAC